jgi:ABC-type sugar transport system permease subunit
MALTRVLPTGTRVAEARLGYALATPALVAIVLIAFFPLISNAWLSLHAVSLRAPGRGQPFVGPANYLALLQDERFWNAIWITAKIAAVSVTAELVLGMAAALIAHQTFRGRGVVRAAMLVPWTLTTVVAARMWEWIFNASYGAFNAVLIGAGVIDGPIAWTASPAYALWVIVGADVWKTTPFVALILLAGLQMIPGELHEVAAIDGATRWQRFWRITLPLCRPALLVALLFRTLDAVRIFDLPYVLTGGGPGFATETLSIYIYRVLFTNLNVGYGATLSFATFVFTMLVAFVYVRLLGATAPRAG